MIKNKIKLSLITLSKTQGGANIAAQRIKLNLQKKFQLESIYCDKKNFLNYCRFNEIVFLFEQNFLKISFLTFFLDGMTLSFFIKLSFHL